MSNSVIKVTEVTPEEGLFVLKGKDGIIMPDRETLESYLNGRKQETEINLICINDSYGNNIEATMEPLIYDPNNSDDILEKIMPSNINNGETGLEQNLSYFRLDHDYTPLGSPKLNSSDDMSAETDELAQTLSILEGCSVDCNSVLIPFQTEQTSVLKSQTTMPGQVSGKNKIKKEEKIFDAGTKQQRQGLKVLHKKPMKEVKSEEEEEEEEVEEEESNDEDQNISSETDSEEDGNDSDFELRNEPKPKSRKHKRIQKKKDYVEIIDKSKRKSGKVAKSQIKSPPVSRQLSQPNNKEVEHKFLEKHGEGAIDQRSLDKKHVKKEKKTPKPILDDFALFSTPDIIRRVGGKQEHGPTTPTNEAHKFARIKMETRTKSTDHNKTKITDSKFEKSKIINTDDKNKDRRMSLDIKSHHQVDRRLSLNLDSKKQVSQSNSKSLVKTTSTPNRTNQVIIQSIDESVESNSSENISSQLDEMPSIEDIRAMIQNEDTKTYSSSLVIPEPSTTSQQNVDQQPINLDSSGLDIDPLLDNINSDLISEDILYQVAQSLAGNTELQSAIDKSLNDDDLVLDPTVQLAINHTHNVESQSEMLQQNEINSPRSSSSNSQRGTQIVRPDGRVVIIPPIERPTTRSRNKRQEYSPITTTTTPKASYKPLDEEHVTGNELDGSEEEEEEVVDDEKSDDDPDKLWCICNQPHNNRFMICCDQCEEWYHGKCVNVTKAMGQLMEQEGREWICVFCKDPTLKRPGAAARRIRKASRASTDSGKSQYKSSTSESNQGKSSSGSICIVCGSPSRKNSIFCSDKCILKQAQTTTEKVVVFERATGKILSGNNAPTATNLDKWLKEHPGFEVVRSKANKSSPSRSLSQSKLKLVKNQSNEGVSLAIQKKGVNVGVLQHTPKFQTSNKNSKSIPHFKIVQKSVSLNEPRTKLIQVQPMIAISTPKAKTTVQTIPKVSTVTTLKSTPPGTSSSSSSTKDKPKLLKTPRARQEEQSNAAPPPKQSENIRDNVKKTLFEQLTNRLKLANDLKLEPDDVTKISQEIESQLYKCFGDTGQKYRNKYRSLIFNIKDIKNQTLWRRICEKSVNPYQLVRLSPDDLASQELALWRERENKHQLDMIKKSELELLNCNRQYVLKTHKGEQILEDNRPKDVIDNTEVISTLNPDQVSSKDLSDSKKDKKSSKHDKDRRHRSKEKSESKDKKKDEKSKKTSRSRSRSKSRERYSRHSEKKKSSRDRSKYHKSSHKSSRHKKELLTTEKLDKKSKEILEQLVDKQIVPPLEDHLWKSVPQEEITTPSKPFDSDSDHEPSSTVTIPTPPRINEVEESPSLPVVSEKPVVEKREKKEIAKIPSPVSNHEERSTSPPPKTITFLWKGTINMVDVAQISVTAHEVSGDCTGLGEELSPALDVVGRISPDTVWEYIGKMKCSNSKAISLIRLNATNLEEKMPYIALYSYLSSRNRLGVIKSLNKAVKDFYILPLASQKPIPQALLPLNGPGFEESRPALLLGIIVRDKRKRPIFDPISPSIPKRTKVEVSVVITPTVSAPVTTPARSYTPPPPLRDPRIKTVPPVDIIPPLPDASSQKEEATDDMDEPYSPEDSDPDIVITPPPDVVARSILDPVDVSSATANVKLTPYKEPTPLMQPFEPFSSKFDTIPGLDEATMLPASSQEIQKKMAELDQKIAMQKAEIDNMSQNIVSTAGADIGSSSLANIALPSNLQQILDSIKGIGASISATDNAVVSTVKDASNNLTMPLLLPKLSSRSVPATSPPATTFRKESIIPLNLPKSKNKSNTKNSPLADNKGLGGKQEVEKTEKGSVLSSLTEEDLIRKAAEMLGDDNKLKMTKEDSLKESYVPSKTIYQPKGRGTSSFASEPVMYNTSNLLPNLSVPPPNILLPTNIAPPPVKRPKVDDQPPVPGLEDEM